MKRCFSLALIFALLGTAVHAPALAEEVVSENIEAAVDLAELAGDTGLTVEGVEIAPEQTPSEAVEESPADNGDCELADPSAEEEAGSVLAADAVEDGAAETEATPKAATGISLSSKKIYIGVKERYSGLAVSAVPAGSVLPAVSWRSSNEKYVKVDASTGVITGVKRGSATVYAKTAGGTEVSCKVKVRKAPRSLSVETTKLALSVGMTAELPAEVSRGSASGTLTYKSSNTKVVAVDANGRLTAVGPGKATVKVRTYNRKSAKCKVQVLPAPATIAFPSDSLVMGVKQSTELNAVALAADGSETLADITYSIDAGSADAGCVALDADTGTVTAVRNGQAVIKAVTQNGVVARCPVTVAAMPKSVALNSDTLTVGVGEISEELMAEVIAPDGAQNCANAVVWTSSNDRVAKVHPETGAVLGVKKGSCTITVTTLNGKTDKCKVQVKKAPSSITLSPKNGVLTVGTYGKYKVSLPSGSSGSVTFESSDPTIASVDESGQVTGLASGTVKITATTYNGKSFKASLLVKPLSSTPTDDDDGGESDVTEYKSSMSNAEKLEYVIYTAQSKLGRPYVYGSFGPNSFDCSGFTTYCFRQIKIELKHSAYTQGYDNSFRQLNMSELKRGDLVYFDTVTDDDLSDHAGLYLGGGKFIHASSSAGKVIVSTLASGYYNRVFSWGRRVLD